QGLRRATARKDYNRSALHQPFAGFFAVEEFDLTFRRFDGSVSPPVRREVFIAADAVTVLPYDPVRDRVLLVEQVRTGPMARGDVNPWQLEAVAGRIDPGETPEGAARREACEEAGLTLGDLQPVAAYYPSTAACSEYVFSYVALCALPDGTAGVFGLEAEAEDIRGHLVDFDDLIDRLDAGELGNAPLILSVQWLLRHRARLRAAAGDPKI
ncbi:MAG: NUDIX domain-containing protein, partial [Paracoccaceae bacterium]